MQEQDCNLNTSDQACYREIYRGKKKKANRQIQITFSKPLDMTQISPSPNSLWRYSCESAQNNVTEFYGSDKEVPLLWDLLQ